MADLLPATPMEDRIDTKARLPVIEPAALAQLEKSFERVDRYAIEPKTSPSEP